MYIDKYVRRDARQLRLRRQAIGDKHPIQRAASTGQSARKSMQSTTASSRVDPCHAAMEATFLISCFLSRTLLILSLHIAFISLHTIFIFLSFFFKYLIHLV